LDLEHFMTENRHAADLTDEPLPNLTVRDVANFYGVSGDVVRYWARNQKIEATKIGGQWRFTKHAVLAKMVRKLTSSHNTAHREAG
jgi:excisionase family DNA binding protein